MKRAIQLLYPLKRATLRLLRWKTQGVKVMLFNPQGELLLIRNSYGRSHLFVLPGGGIRPFETPAEAAVREVREEVGVTAERVTPLSTYYSEAEGKRDIVYLFTAFTAESPRADGVEVEEARFFPLDALPATVSDATLRRIAEYKGERPPARAW
jgi:8-oxo-dGTP pyrophosphatase MutT (NUDIX family)